METEAKRAVQNNLPVVSRSGIVSRRTELTHFPHSLRSHGGVCYCRRGSREEYAEKLAVDQDDNASDENPFLVSTSSSLL